MRGLNGGIGKPALSALAVSQLPSFQILLTPLLNELAGLEAPAVLVLEDYHAIRSEEIHDTVAFFLQHLPDPLHLVILTRSAPDLPLGILRARDEMIEIEAAELRFDPQEAQAFLRENVKDEIPRQAVDKLLDRTEGWVAGLRLAALALQNKGSEAAGQVLESFSGSHRYVADYLIREEFSIQPEAVQEFLLKTCFLSRLSGALCDALTGINGGEATLQNLARENLFLVQLEHGGGRTWYRYNPLFAESIQALARQRLGESGVRSLYEKASDWYAYQQMYAEAIETALAAGLYERASELVETYVGIYSLNEMRTLARWIEEIPQALTFQRPAVCQMYAQVILFASDRFAPATARRIEPYLSAAESVLQAAGDEAGVGSVLALRGMMLIWQGDFQRGLDCAYRSLEKLPESEVFWRGVSLLNAAFGDLFAGRMLSAQDRILEARAFLGASQNLYGLLAANGMMSRVYFAQGEMDLCIELSRQIMAEAVGDDSMLDDQGEARLILARVAYERNELAAAEGYASEALELGKRRHNELLQAQAAGRLALARAAQGKPAIDELKSLSARLQSSLALREARQVEMLLAIRLGEIIDNWLEANPASLLSQKEQEAFILARQRIDVGKPGEALELLAPFLADAAPNGRLRSHAEALCLAALAHEAAGDLSQARQELVQALTIGQEKGFRRLFLDEGERMAALLRETLPGITRRALTLYASALLQSFSQEATPAAQAQPGIAVLVEPLSQQEIRVLKLLAAGLTNGEIAAELVVSTNTVKTHVKSIYRKLDVSNRVQLMNALKRRR